MSLTGQVIYYATAFVGWTIAALAAFQAEELYEEWRRQRYWRRINQSLIEHDPTVFATVDALKRKEEDDKEMPLLESVKDE